MPNPKGQPRSVRIAASLWSVRSAEQQNTLQRLNSAGLEVVHWDVTDGKFAAPGGFQAGQARAMTEAVGMKSEAHLMVAEPVDHIDAWTDFCDLVVVHVESNGWQEAIKRIEARGSRPALALSPGTPTTTVTSLELAVLVMSITPGQAGSEFQRSAFKRVESLAGGRDLIGLDGGVTATLGQEARAIGANWLISGTDLCGSVEPQRWLELTGGEGLVTPNW